MTRMRLRELGIQIGHLPTGPKNAILDVPGVRVGHVTLIQDSPSVARTGVTVVVPRRGEIWENHAFAGYHVFNGYGEMTGLPWLGESGLLTSPVAITNTYQVGAARDALAAYAHLHGYERAQDLPVAAETDDGWLNDARASPLTQEHIFQALDGAQDDVVEEGSVGGGTGMICHEFKGGIGTASRQVETAAGRYTVGALVQANYGLRRDLRVNGVPVGVEIGPEHTPSPWAQTPASGSIIAVLATDAPLLPVQCRRLARRATVGLARVGGLGNDSSGDIFLAFATGNEVPIRETEALAITMLPHAEMDGLFRGAAESVEEAILNALTAAETMTGFRGRTVHALPLDELRRVMEGH